MIRARAMSDISERFSMDFLGATQSEGEPAIFYCSTNEDQYGDRMSASSIWVVSSSMKDYTGEVAMMAQRFERQLANPTPIPSSEASLSQKRSGRREQVCHHSRRLTKGISTSDVIAGQKDVMGE